MSDHPLIQQIERTAILPNSLAIWGMGQMGFAIKGSDALIYIDLCLSNIVEEQSGAEWYRAYDPPVPPSELTIGDVYFITHEHMDHLDSITVQAVNQVNPRIRFVAPGWCRQPLIDLGIQPERIIVPEALKPFTLEPTTMRVTAIPSAHYEKTFDAELGYRWFGYLIEWNGVRLYHAGDTIIYADYLETMRTLPAADIAIIPVNGRDTIRETQLNATGNLMPVEAAYLARELGWDMVIPGHNDLYPNNAIPFGEIVHALETHTPRQKYKIVQPGELYYYVK